RVALRSATIPPPIGGHGWREWGSSASPNPHRRRRNPPGHAQAKERRVRAACACRSKGSGESVRTRALTEGERSEPLPRRDDVRRSHRISQVTGQRGRDRTSGLTPSVLLCCRSMSMGLQTPLYQTHLAAGARMVDFGGWDMPVNYGSQIEEHHAVRKQAGMFDVSHMLVADVIGPR